MTDETSQDQLSEDNIDHNEGYRKYLEKTRGNPFSDISLKLLDMGLSLHLPIPVTSEILQKYYQAGVIRKEDLKDCGMYWGKCRNASLAEWNADTQKFYYLRRKFSHTFSEEINHMADDDGYDVFVPIKQLTYIEDVT